MAKQIANAVLEECDRGRTFRVTLPKLLSGVQATQLEQKLKALRGVNGVYIDREYHTHSVYVNPCYDLDELRGEVLAIFEEKEEKGGNEQPDQG